MGFLDGFAGWFGRKYGPRIVYQAGARSTAYGRGIYEHDIARSIIDCIATHVAKADALHVIVDGGGRISKINRKSDLFKLLNQQPNQIMSGYDLKYKLASQLQTHTTAMAYIRWDGAKAVGIYPINYQQFEFLEVADGSWAVAFTDSTGAQYKLPLDDVVVLRKYYNGHPVYGDSNAPLLDALTTMQAADKGVQDAMSIANKARVLFKTKRAAIANTDVNNSADQFASRFENAAKNGGVIGVDLTEEASPFAITPYTLNAAQYDKVRDRLLAYFRVPDKVLHSDYDDTTYQAFYESVIEPILVQMGQAFTNAAFSREERDRGNRILMTAPMLLHASTVAKTQLIATSRETGLFTVNEQREMFGYPPVEDGDERQVSLNYVKASEQDKYQTGAENAPKGDDADAAEGKPTD